MAEVRSNMLIRGTSGKLGDQIVMRLLRDGRTILCKIPDFSRRKLSKDQKAHHQRFKEAAAYAKYAAQRQPIYAELAAGTMKNAYNVALGDWFNPPVIHRVERKGKAIRIQASDDVRVTAVQVMILDEAGKAVEKGSAAQVNDSWWEYIPQEAGRVQVEARDLAGNVTKQTMD